MTDPQTAASKACPSCETPLTIAPGIGPYCAVEGCLVTDDAAVWPNSPVIVVEPQAAIEKFMAVIAERDALREAGKDVMAWFYRLEGTEPSPHTALGRLAAALKTTEAEE